MQCSIFERFETPPSRGLVSLLERECRFIAEPEITADGSNLTLGQTSLRLQGPLYNDFVITTEDGGKADFEGASFLPLSEDSHWTTQLRTAWNRWREEGIVSALQSLRVSAETPGSATPFPLHLVDFLLHFIGRIQALYGSLVPHSQMTVIDMISKYSRLPNWRESVVRAVAFHPRLSFLAIARQDDQLEVRNLANGNQKILLRDRQQVGVTCMQWAPHCDSLLGVGASKGILIWHIDPTSPTTRFVTSWVRYETSPGHGPISDLSWCPWGNFIVSTSPNDNNLLLWAIPLGVATRVRREKGGGVARVSWSPDGRRVFAGNVLSVFRVWETEKWTCDRWSNFSGRCKCACWSPKGDLLLFALQNDPSLYYLSFHGNDEVSTGSSSAIKCADLSPCTLCEGDDEILVGGEVQDMVWDSTGQRLAVIFTSESPSARLIAIFRTRIGQLLEILPGGFIQGKEGECPSLMTFQEHCSTGALLAVVWSSGRISFIPLYFQGPSDLQASPELVPSHTPFSCPGSIEGLNESLNRPALNRTREQYNSIHGTPLYSVFN